MQINNLKYSAVTCLMACLLAATPATARVPHPECMSADSDHDDDGFGWENNASCIVAGHVSGETANYSCNRTDSDPDGDGFGLEYGSVCRVVPVCASADSDPDGDGYGWEQEASCRVEEQLPPLFNILATTELFGLSDFVTAVGIANFGDTLTNENNVFTLFAPTNDAIGQLSDSELRGLGVWDFGEDAVVYSDSGNLDSVLLNHLLVGQAVPSGAALTLVGETVSSGSGGDLLIGLQDGDLKINDATVIVGDIDASNGVIHVVDKVIQDCSVSAKNEWLYNNLLDSYYFSDQVDSNINFNDYDDPEALLDDMKVKPDDRFSFLVDRTSSEASTSEGRKINLGYYLERDNEGLIRFVLVYDNSPAGLAGLKRGDIWVAMNNVPVDELSSEQFLSFIGTDEQPLEAIFTVMDPLTGIERDAKVLNLTDGYVINTVLHKDVIDVDGFDSTVGYLVFDEFSSAVSSVELDDAMNYFIQEGVGELILDLRNNGGGASSISDQLIGQISGLGNSDEAVLAFATRFNQRFSQLDEVRSVSAEPLSLDLKRLVVIVSGGTASASEKVINVLRGLDVEVLIVGEGDDENGDRSLTGTTFGKSYSSISLAKCDIELNAVMAERFNARGDTVGTGFTPDCPVFDDFKTPWGFNVLGEGNHEIMLDTALEYLVTGSCPTLSNTITAKLPGVIPTDNYGLFGSIEKVIGN